MFCLLVVLVKSSLLAKRLARKTPLRKPNRGEGIISIKPRLKSVWLSWYIVFFHCLIAWLHDMFVLSSGRTWYTLASMARYSLFVLKVPLKTKQTKICELCCSVAFSCRRGVVHMVSDIACCWCRSAVDGSGVAANTSHESPVWRHYDRRLVLVCHCRLRTLLPKTAVWWRAHEARRPR